MKIPSPSYVVKCWWTEHDSYSHSGGYGKESSIVFKTKEMDIANSFASKLISRELLRQEHKEIWAKNDSISKLHNMKNEFDQKMVEHNNALLSLYRECFPDFIPREVKTAFGDGLLMKAEYFLFPFDGGGTLDKVEVQIVWNDSLVKWQA